MFRGRRKERHRFTPFQRASAAVLVMQALEPVERQRVLDTMDPQSTKFPVLKKGRPKCEWRSVLGDVHQQLCELDAHYRRVFDCDEDARDSARGMIRFWYIRLCCSEDKCLDDSSRAPKAQVGDSLTEPEWRELCNVLVGERYIDAHKNSRRFPSFEDYREHLEVEIRKNGCAVKRMQLQNLDGMYRKSSAKSWQGLLQAVVVRFSLKRELETFKIDRMRHMAQQCALRLTGQAPMLEVHRTKVKSKDVPVKACQKLKRAVSVQPSTSPIAQPGSKQRGRKRKQPTEEIVFKKEWLQVSAPLPSCT